MKKLFEEIQIYDTVYHDILRTTIAHQVNR